MSEYWQCPFCYSVFSKNMYNVIDPFFSYLTGDETPIEDFYCPECNRELDTDLFLNEMYDLKLEKKPSFEKLKKESKDLYIKLMWIEARLQRKQGISDPEKISEKAINKLYEILFTKYGLSEEEYIVLIKKILKSF